MNMGIMSFHNDSRHLLLFPAAMRRHPVPLLQLPHFLVVVPASAAVSLCITAGYPRLPRG